MSYLNATNELYKDAALTPDVGLCCTTSPKWQLAGLNMPAIMEEMNYGCGSVIDPRDLVNDPNVLYVGVGGGMEILQFSYFSRKPNGVIGVDVVDEMLDACQANLQIAEEVNPWFKKEFVDLRKGDALNLPVEDNTIDIAGQNCLFNIFKEDDLKKAIAEMYRVLKPGGRLVMSDPICDQGMPENLKDDDKLRALCLSGSLPMKDYIKVLTDAGFGTIEVRAKYLYRILSPTHYDCNENIRIDSIEICAIKDPMPEDGPCIFTGKSAVYTGTEEYYDDGKGHTLMQNMPISVCDKTAGALGSLNHPDIYISESTFHYNGGGCC